MPICGSIAPFRNAGSARLTTPTVPLPSRQVAQARVGVDPDLPVFDSVASGTIQLGQIQSPFSPCNNWRKGMACATIRKLLR